MPEKTQLDKTDAGGETNADVNEAQIGRRSRNSAERLKEFPQCAFCYVKGRISDVKLHGDK
jgi:hypothetical protein